MADGEEQSFTIPWLSLITLACVSSGIVFFFPQLTSSRPGGGDPTLLDKTFGDETVNARLWQDPLGVATQDGEVIVEGQKKKDRLGHSVTRFQELFINACFSSEAEEVWNPIETEIPELKKPPENVQVLAVMIPGGPYVEDVERRLRSRRAVLEALGSGWRNRGFDPEKEHEIGYFSVPWPGYRPSTTLCAHSLERIRHSDPKLFDEFKRPLGWTAKIGSIMPRRRVTPYQLKEQTRTSLLVPYEWCEAESLQTHPSQILVLWLDDDKFFDAPIARLADLFSWFQFRLIDTAGNVSFYLPAFNVIGPDNSGALHRMLLEASERPWEKDTVKLLARTHIFSSQASAAEHELFSDIPFAIYSDIPFQLFPKNTSAIQRNAKTLLEESVKKLDPNSHFTFDRTNLLDDKIVDAMRAELGSQHIKPEDHIVLISEEDTYYARALFSTFMEANSRSGCHFQVSAYTYLRGIDGQLPSDTKQKSDKNDDEKNDNNSQTQYKSQRPPSRPAEQTEGLNQADDIRRLAEELKTADKTSQIKAIGLLGSDVYDKLEILKALRPYFPEALFFTSHLDARFAHPDEWKEAHNLIVATDFTLELDEPKTSHTRPTDQQVGPFRDSGQTSLYEATLEAIGGISVNESRPSRVKVFEIGHDGAVELGVAPKRLDSASLARVIVASTLVGLLLIWVRAVSRPEGRSTNKKNINTDAAKLSI